MLQSPVSEECHATPDARYGLVLVTVITSTPFAQAPQEKIDRDTYFRIRSEAAERSQILNTLHMLTDVYGPRLTGSPNLKAAQDWVSSERRSGG